MAEYMYKNCQPVPVTVSAKRGGMKTFRVGETSTDEWYSRFLGPRFLSRVPVTSVEVTTRPIPNMDKIDEILSKIQEDTNDYTKRGGMYVCKHCDTFRTGSMQLFMMHLSDYHQIEQLTIVTNKKLVPVVENKEELSMTKAPQVHVEETVIRSVQLEPEQKTYTCTNCGKTFKSEGGRDRHIGSQHSV